MACHPQWKHYSFFLGSVCTHQSPELHFKWVMMSLRASCHATLPLRPQERHSTLLWVSTCSYPFHGPVSDKKAVSQTAMHGRHGETAVTGTSESGWFINPAFFYDLYQRPWSFFLAKGCQMHSSCHMAQFFYFEWWGYRFLVDKIGHAGQSCVCNKKEKLQHGRSWTSVTF